MLCMVMATRRSILSAWRLVVVALPTLRRYHCSQASRSHGSFVLLLFFPIVSDFDITVWLVSRRMPEEEVGEATANESEHDDDEHQRGVAAGKGALVALNVCV